VSRHLYTRHLPDPDLVVRTSGEMRLSNFLLWQLAYAEIYVTPTLWPEFRGTHLLEGIAEYQKRERRYGGLAGDAADPQASHGDRLKLSRAGAPAPHTPLPHAAKSDRS
jgi:undecaprenyl diphosphate synthase